MLLLDAGNTLMGADLALQTEGQIMVDAMNLMAYDAMTIGSMDLAKGIDVLLQRAEEATFVVVSSNLIWSDTQEPVLPPYTVLERGGVRFGVLGVTYPGALQGLQSLSPGVELLDPTPQVARYVAELRDGVDVLVVLSHLGIHDDKALAAAVGGIDVIVGGRSRQLMREPQLVGNTAIVQVGYDGEWLGRLDLAGSPGSLRTSGYEILFMRPDVADDREMVDLIRKYEAQFSSKE